MGYRGSECKVEMQQFFEYRLGKSAAETSRLRVWRWTVKRCWGGFWERAFCDLVVLVLGRARAGARLDSATFPKPHPRTQADPVKSTRKKPHFSRGLATSSLGLLH